MLKCWKSTISKIPNCNHLFFNRACVALTFQLSTQVFSNLNQYTTIMIRQPEMIECSSILGYAMAFCPETDTYILFVCTVCGNNIMFDLIKSLTWYENKANILLITDEERAKDLVRSDRWREAINDIMGNIEKA